MRVVAGADERAGFYVAEAHLERLVFEFGEFAGRVKARHGEMIPRGAQILPDGQDVATGVRQIAEDFQQFVRLFAEADHHAGFGNSRGVQLLGVSQ